MKTKIRDYAAKGRLRYVTYLSVNPDLEPSPFLQCMHPLTRDVVRFRVGSHSLPIETGRWCRRKREERLCDMCGVIGDEGHYLYSCARIERSDLTLGVMRDVWLRPDIFNFIRRLKKIELL